MLKKYKTEIVLFLSFFVITFSLGKYWNVLFDLDTPRVLADITVREYNHSRILVHPLLIIFIKPIYKMLDIVVHDPLITITLIQCLMSSISLVVFYKMLKCITKNKMLICLFTFLFAVNFSQIIFTVSIETYIMAQFFLILMWYFFVKNKDKELQDFDYIFLILLGVGSIAITITNFFQFVIVAFFLIVRKKDFPFDKDTIEKYYEKYVGLTKENLS